MQRLILTAGAIVSMAIPQADAVAPANDDFASSIDLGSLTSTSQAGTSIDATSEFGEPNPTSNPDIEPHATVWWSFSVPADGFVEISTESSSFDTLLGVFTGSDLFSLIEIGSDNDSGAGSTSKLTVPVFSGLQYHIQVSGISAATGSIALTIGPGSAPSPPVLNSITLLPSPIDVTSASGTVTATLHIDSPDGFDYGEISVFDPADNATGSGGFFDATYRTAGDEFSGTYTIPLAVSTYSPPGPYNVDLMLLETNGDAASLIDAGTFSVINNGTVDSSPPVLSSFSFSPTVVDITLLGESVSVDVAATDDLGVQFVVIDVYDPDDFFLFSAIASLTSGSSTNGTWSATLPIARGSVAGGWRIDARVIDFSGKLDDFEPVGSEDILTVTNNGSVDEDAPVAVDLQFTPNPVVRGNPVTVTIDFSDDLSGLAGLPSNLFLDFFDAAGSAQFSDPFSLADLIAGTSVAGTLQYPTTIQATAPTGIWDTELRLQDGAGNSARYGNFNPGGGAQPYPAGVSGQLHVLETGGTAYAIWIARYPSLVGPDADPQADPDGDGWCNLLELPFDGDPTLALGLDPHKANFPAPIITSTDLKLQFTLVQPNLNGTEGSPIIVSGRRSDDLVSHTPIGLTDLGGGRYEVSVPIDSGPREFLRLQVDDPN